MTKPQFLLNTACLLIAPLLVMTIFGQSQHLIATSFAVWVMRAIAMGTIVLVARHAFRSITPVVGALATVSEMVIIYLAFRHQLLPADAISLMIAATTAISVILTPTRATQTPSSNYVIPTGG